MPGSPAHTANASLYFEKAGLNIRVSYNFASDFIDEMGESTFYDRYYDKVNYMDANASYTFGKKIKTTFYAETNRTSLSATIRERKTVPCKPNTTV